jgi:hypothetical protein
MLKKLESALKSPKGSLLVLALKAIIWGVLLTFVNRHWLFIIAFLLVSFYFYLRKPFNASRLLASSLILIFTSLLIMRTAGGLPGLSLPSSSWLSIIIAFFFSLLYFLLLGIKNLVFIHRQSLYRLLNGLLFSGILILFLGAPKSGGYFALSYLLIGAASFLLLREYLAFDFESAMGKKNLLALVFSFLTLQFLWVVSLLPIGFLNAAAFSLLIILILVDLAVHNWLGALSRQLILRNASIFLILSIIIFALSKWSP